MLLSVNEQYLFNLSIFVMPNYCSNSLQISNLTAEQKNLISNSFIKKQETPYPEWESHFLTTFCPEPDYSIVPVAKCFPEIDVDFSKTPEDIITALVNKPEIYKDSWYEWRLQNWGTKWEFCDVTLNPDTDTSEFECSFLTAWSPPIVGLFRVSTMFPDALFTLFYTEDGFDFTGVTFLKDGKAFDQDFSVSNIRKYWLKQFDPNLFERFQADEAEEDIDLIDEINDLWCDHDSDAIDNILDPVAGCLKQLILSSNIPSEPIQLMIGSQLIEVGVEPWVPPVIKSMSLEDATKLVQETIQSISKPLASAAS